MGLMDNEKARESADYGERLDGEDPRFSIKPNSAG